MILFESDRRNAAFYFAAEEYIMRALKPEAPVLMLWTTGDTVMIGANQTAKAECDLDYAKEKGIAIVRRPSGGGAIFTDKGTLQYTVILTYADAEAETNHTNRDSKETVREWLAGPLIETLAGYGVAAVAEGRNDVTISGRKISGTAQHIRYGYICSHGSLLFNTDLEKLTRALTVDREKIQTKAVASVRARVTKIADHAEEKDMPRFREAFIESYSHKEPLSRREFSTSELTQIEEIEQEKYAAPEWTFGRDPAFTFTNKKRFPGGGVEVFIDVKGGIVQSAKITGDFLAPGPVTELEASLAGVPHTREALTGALQKAGAPAALGSVSAEELLSVLC